MIYELDKIDPLVIFDFRNENVEINVSLNKRRHENVYWSINISNDASMSIEIFAPPFIFFINGSPYIIFSDNKELTIIMLRDKVIEEIKSNKKCKLNLDIIAFTPNIIFFKDQYNRIVKFDTIDYIGFKPSTIEELQTNCPDQNKIVPIGATDYHNNHIKYGQYFLNNNKLYSNWHLNHVKDLSLFNKNIILCVLLSVNTKQLFKIVTWNIWRHIIIPYIVHVNPN